MLVLALVLVLVLVMVSVVALVLGWGAGTGTGTGVGTGNGFGAGMGVQLEVVLVAGPSLALVERQGAPSLGPDLKRDLAAALSGVVAAERPTERLANELLRHRPRRPSGSDLNRDEPHPTFYKVLGTVYEQPSLSDQARGTAWDFLRNTNQTRSNDLARRTAFDFRA